jgi:hypothetical protein
MTTLTLYDLIKQKVQEKGHRPLKVVCDWDEVLQPLKMMLLYQLSSKKLSLPEYFKRFWERARIHYTKSHGRGGQFVVSQEEAKRYFGQSHTYSYIDPYDENEKKNMPRLNAYRDKVDIEFYHDPLRYEKTPWTSLAGELLQCLKEDLISELIITTSYLRKNNPTGKKEKKDNKFDKTFGLFPQCKFDKMAVAPEKEGEVPVPHRWNWIKENHSDFDVFIDDNPIYVEKAWELFPEKTHVMPDYYTTKHLQKQNIYHVKTILYELSDLTDEDFKKAAQEYKVKTSETKSDIKRKNYWPLIIGVGLVGGVIVGLVIWLKAREKN